MFIVDEKDKDQEETFEFEIEEALEDDADVEEKSADPEENSQEEEDESEDTSQDAEDKDEPDSKQQFGKRAQKRIRGLVKSRRELEDKVLASEQKLKEMEEKLETQKGTSFQSEEFAATQYAERLVAESAALETEFNDAHDANDSKALFAVQTRMAEVAAAKRELDTWKTKREKAPEKKEPIQEQAPNSNQNQQAPTAASKRAQTWHGKNKWFLTDVDMTETAKMIHSELIDEDGVDADTDNYFNELDNRMRELYPEKFSGRKGKTTPVSGRSNISGKGNRKVKLTQEQVGIAKRMGVPLERYAKEVAKLNQRQGKEN